MSSENNKSKRRYVAPAMKVIPLELESLVLKTSFQGQHQQANTDDQGETTFGNGHTDATVVDIFSDLGSSGTSGSNSSAPAASTSSARSSRSSRSPLALLIYGTALPGLEAGGSIGHSADESSNYYGIATDSLQTGDDIMSDPLTDLLQTP
ncbi:MAG: hypothetical protein IJ722_03790 [Alloprevotella sp.]|nr:hypothetical protein [Alloprevotella sp.]